MIWVTVFLLIHQAMTPHDIKSNMKFSNSQIILSKKCEHYQYNFLYTISNNIELYEEPVPRTKKIPHRAFTFEASEENRIVYESLYCCLLLDLIQVKSTY